MGIAVKAVQAIFVTGQMVKPGGVAEVSVHEALALYERGEAVPAEAADFEGITEYPVSGTVDTETIHTGDAPPVRPGAAMLAQSKPAADLIGGA